MKKLTILFLLLAQLTWFYPSFSSSISEVDDLKTEKETNADDKIEYFIDLGSRFQNTKRKRKYLQAFNTYGWKFIELNKIDTFRYFKNLNWKIINRSIQFCSLRI